MQTPYYLTADEVTSHFKVDVNRGLTNKQVVESRKKHGKNELPPPQKASFFRLIIKQFEDLLVLILLGAAIVSLLLGFLEESDSLVEAFIEPAVIMLILIANAIVGVVQETNAENAIEKLKEYEAHEAVVVRDGRRAKKESAELVPGDVVVIAVGDRVPADCRLINLVSSVITIDESMLTGESEPVMKQLEPIPRQKHIVDQDKRNILFSGSLVVRGNGIAVVVGTGQNTSIGKIQMGLSDQDEVKTPLQQKLDEFAELLSKVILVICILVWVINIGKFSDPEHGGMFMGAVYYFKIAVALAVAAIPEGLPAVVTTCLALGTKKMARKNAIVRSLPSVETLGCTTVICSDKTGTLTTNKMCVRNVLVVNRVDKQSKEADLKVYNVEGEDFAPYGKIINSDDNQSLRLPAAEDHALNLLGRISSLCNESHLEYDEKAEDKNKYKMSGEATEAALTVLAEKIGVPDPDECRKIFDSKDPEERIEAARNYWNDHFERLDLLEFSRDRKSMSVRSKDQKGRKFLHVKGAPESIIERCIDVETSQKNKVELTPDLKESILEKVSDFTNRGLRVLAMAYIADPSDDYQYNDYDKYAQIESEMTLVGFAGMLDPPRQEVAQSIKTCDEAGVRVIVITGDNQATAEAICRRIGVFGEDEDCKGKSFTGSDFMSMTAAEKNDVVVRASLFSRVEPSHKLALVDLLQKQGEVVAMTGDGVNDAPALKKADIGVGMGTGTAVAKEASDMILQDDNFATIVMAVESGRSIYANTKQFIRYLISSNIGEVACIFITAAIGMPEALIPVQLLWVNLVTDGLPATALGFNKPDADIMRQPPRGRTEKIIDGWMFFRYMMIGLYIGVGTVYGFIWWFTVYSDGPQVTYHQLTNFHTCSPTNPDFEGVDCAVFGDARASTVSLSVLVLIEMFNTFNALSENQSLLVTPPWSNPWVGLAVVLSLGLHCMILYVPFFTEIFSTAALNMDEWWAVFYISFPVILFDEILKVISRTISARHALEAKKAR